jgi:hypothetical protein
VARPERERAALAKTPPIRRKRKRVDGRRGRFRLVRSKRPQGRLPDARIQAKSSSAQAGFATGHECRLAGNGPAAMVRPGIGRRGEAQSPSSSRDTLDYGRAAWEGATGLAVATIGKSRSINVNHVTTTAVSSSGVKAESPIASRNGGWSRTQYEQHASLRRKRIPCLRRGRCASSPQRSASAPWSATHRHPGRPRPPRFAAGSRAAVSAQSVPSC